MSPVVPGQSPKYSGIIDSRYLQILAERVEKLESFVPIFSAERVGSLTVKPGEQGTQKPLVGGPELTVPRTGAWLIYLSIRGRTNEAGVVELLAGVSVNGGGMNVLFDFVSTAQFAMAMTTNYFRANLTEGDKLTTLGSTNAGVTSIFDLATIMAQRLS